MRNALAASLLTLLLGLSCARLTYAHHGYAEFDMKHSVKLTGTVTSLSLANPHSTFSFDVKDEKGNVSHWGVQFGVLRDLMEQGWTDDTLKPGDEIKATVHPKKDGDHQGVLAGEIKYADGRPLTLTPPKGQQHYSRPIRW
jgi:hypothetical protein